MMTDRNPRIPRAGDALVVVDVQRDFLPGGALPVPRGDEVVEPLNRVARLFAKRSLPVFASRDWHSGDHCSFVAQGGPWPVHCVADTPGAQFAPRLQLPDDVQIVSKAARADRETHSAFSEGDFVDRLRRQHVRRLFAGGLATEYCVLATVRDALERGYGVVLLTDAVRAIDPQRGAEAIQEMIRLGAVAANWEDIAGPPTP